MILARTAVQILIHEGRLRLVEHRRQIQLMRLPVRACQRGVQRTCLSNRLVHSAEAQLRQIFPDFLGDEHEEVLHELGLPGEPLPEQRILGGHTNRARVQVAHPHHDAAGHYLRRGRESELFCPEQRSDHHIATRLELTVHLDHNSIT